MLPQAAASCTSAHAAPLTAHHTAASRAIVARVVAVCIHIARALSICSSIVTNTVSIGIYKSDALATALVASIISTIAAAAALIHLFFIVLTSFV